MHQTVEMSKVSTDYRSFREGEKNDGVDKLHHSKPSYTITLKFVELWYKVKAGKKPSAACQGNSDLFPATLAEKTRPVLKGITGMASPGEMLAVMGPSGSGKSTLLSALGGRLFGPGLTGSILANGDRFDKFIRKRVGFVSQEDVLYPHLTVRETLIFCSLLRQPLALANKAKIEAAEEWIQQLGLRRCENTIIGNALVRGVSGGERKRVSIAHEMLLNPSVIILDEPTSGLDATAALTVVETVVRLARSGRTVVMSIHQPSSRVFQTFDSLLLLCEGACIYFGSGSGAMAYFHSIGFMPSFPVNPADFLLDLAHGIYENESAPSSQCKQTLVDSFNAILLPEVKSPCKQIARRAAMEEERTSTCSAIAEWTNHFTVLLRRSMKERKQECFNAFRLLQISVSLVLSGVMWWHSDVREVRDRLGLFFCTVMFWTVFSCHSAVFVFLQDRPVFAKERASLSYSLSSYFMARMLGELVLELALPAAGFTVTYWMAALNPDAIPFFLSLAVLTLLVLAAQGLGLFLGAAIANARQASTAAGVIIMAFVLAGGYFTRKPPSFVAWLKYVSIPYYGYELLVHVQYGDGETVWAAMGCHNGGGTRYAASCAVIENDVRKNIHPGASVAALLLMFIAYRFLAYLSLRRVR